MPDDLDARVVALGIDHPYNREPGTVTENSRTLKFTTHGFEQE